MPAFRGRFNSVVVPLITLLVLLLLFGIYQRSIVKSREAYLTEHGFRLLAAVGRQLDVYLDSISITVEAARKKDVPDPARYLNYFLRDQFPYSGSQELNVNDQGKDQAQQCPEKAVANNPRVFSLQFGGEPCPFLRTFSNFPISGRLHLDKGIRERLNFGEGYFDDILIANQQGQVLIQKAQDKRIVNLFHLTSSPTLVEAGQAGSSGGSSGDPKQQVGDQEASAKSAWEALSESSNVLAVTVAGENYRLFVEPLQLSLNRRPKESLILCGLWRTDRLSSDSFAMPYSYVIWFGLTFVAIGCFLWPFLKINYMSRTERLRQRDGWLAAFSIFIGTTSVTLMILAAAYASRVATDIDGDLTLLAERIQQNVDGEISRVLTELATLSARPQVEELASAKQWNPRTRILSKQADDLNEYPYFDFAFWLDGTGIQQVKFTSDRRSTPRTDVSSYPFFISANVGDHLIARAACPPPPERVIPGQIVCIDNYSLEPMISPNTGEFYTTIAAPYPFKGPGSSLTVQALAIRPLSLVGPVLPPNFGFAVLDRNGRVLFHSDASRNLSENFIQECKDPSIVQAALFSQSPQHVDLVYSGKDRRALLTKVTGLAPEALTLVVFHNVDLDQTVELTIVLIVLVLTGLCGLVILAAAFIDGVRGAAYPPEWAWPRHENSSRYALILTVNALLVFVFFVTFSRNWELSLLAVTVSVVFAGILSTYLLATKSTAQAFHRWLQGLQSHFEFIYVAACVSLLAVTAVVPTVGFFKFAHDAASELATKHEQVTLVDKRLERAERISACCHDLWATTYVDCRFKENLDRYDELSLKPVMYWTGMNSSDIGGGSDGSKESECSKGSAGSKGATKRSEGSQSSKDSKEGLHRRFDQALQTAFRLFPANQLGTEMRMLPFESASSKDPHAQFDEDPDGIFRVTIGSESVVASFTPWGLGGEWMWLALIMIVVGCWLTLLMKKIFPRKGANSLLEWKPGDKITDNTIVLREPACGTRSPLAGISAADHVDLRVNLANPTSKLYFRSHVVVLDHFDFNMHNRESNLARLLLLERLLYKEGRLVVIGSFIDPVDYLSQVEFGILADNARDAAELLGRWKLVMSSFRQVVLKDRRLTNEVEAGADSCYAALWSTLTPGERLVLYQLSQDGWANPQNDQAIQQLRNKGLLTDTPMVRIVNDSFRLFVKNAQDEKEIAEWERQEKESSWRTVKFSLVTIAVTLAAWLLYVQKDLFHSAIGYVATLGSAVTAIYNLVGAVRGRSGAVPKAPDSSEA